MSFAYPSSPRIVLKSRAYVGALLVIALAVFTPLAVLAAEGERMPGDVRVTRLVHAVDALPLDYVMQIFTIVGGGTGLVVLLALGLLVLVLRRQFAAAAFVAAGVFGAGLITRALKDATARPRPGLVDSHDRAFLAIGMREIVVVVVIVVAVVLVTRWRRYGLLFAGVLGASLGLSLLLHAVSSPTSGVDSFPSGHATGAAALATAFAALAWNTPRRRAAIAVATLFAFLVGLSRVYFGVHYPSDLLAGWAVGAAWVACLLLLAPLVPQLRRIAQPAYRRAVVASHVSHPDDA